MDSIELEIRISPHGPNDRQFRASVVRPHASAGGSHVFQLPEQGELSPGRGDWRDLRRPNAPRDKSILRILTDEGRALFQLVFQGDILIAFDRAYRQARLRKAWFRLQFSFDYTPEAVNLPWETLVSPERNTLALLSRISIERRLIRAPPIEKPHRSGKGKLRVLLVGACPEDMPKLDLEKELEWIQAALGKVAEIRRLEHATESSLAEALAEEPGFDVVHFLGHGDFEGEEGGLWLETDSGAGERITSSELPSIFRRPISFVFLNICHGGRSSAQPFAGLAEALLLSGVLAVVAMRREISDPGAISLARHFYSQVSQGKTLTQAMAKARQQVDPRLGDWSVPLLFLSEGDFALRPVSRKLWIVLGTVAVGVLLGFWYMPAGDPAPCARPLVERDPRCPSPAGFDLPLIFVPAGSFDQGSLSGETDERPIHRVTISKDFCMGAFEVTEGLYAEVMELAAVPAPRARYPVESAKWVNAEQFLRRLEERFPGAGFRLPTSAEWEYAARAGQVGDEDPERAQPANCRGTDDGDIYREASAAGCFAKNAWGFYDMTGNVWEWTQDWGGEPFRSGEFIDPRGAESGETKVRRGGSYLSVAKNCRVSTRNEVQPDRKQEAAGFRVVREPVAILNQK